MKNLKTSFKSSCLAKKTMPVVVSILFTAGISTNFNANAIVVTDPSSYGYYIEQIKKSVEQIETLKGTLNEAQHLSKEFDGFMQDLRSKFDFVGNIKRALDSELSAFENYKRSLSTSAKKTLDFSRKFDMKNLRDVIDTNLDGIYVDPTNPDYSASQIKKLRTIERQRLLKEGLIKTEEKLALLEQKYKDISELASRARNTSNSKEALDLNNALLVEILTALQSLIEVTSTLGQAEMAAGFINYSKEAHERKEKIDNKPLPSGSKFPTARARDEWYDGCHAFKRKNGHTNTTVNGVDCPQKAYRKATEKRNKRFEKFRDPRI